MSRLLQTGKNQVTQTYAQHAGWSKGIDVVKAPGRTDKITAHTAGTVIKVMTEQVTGRNDPEGMGYGNYVMILHSGNYVTLYAHLASVAVKAGQSVGQGQTIGVMGNTGNSFGAHLHFEIRRYSVDPKTISNLHDTAKFTWLDPTLYIDADLSLNSSEIYYRVQTGSFTVLANAVRQAKKLKAAGFPAIIKKFEKNYRVQVGAYENKSNAESYLKTIKKAGYKKAYITTESGTDVGF